MIICASRGLSFVICLPLQDCNKMRYHSGEGYGTEVLNPPSNPIICLTNTQTKRTKGDKVRIWVTFC